MKIESKVSVAALGLVFIGSSVFAQSLADAKKAIDAEQFQKAKIMLKNLTVTQSTKDENFFYLGLTYLQPGQDYPDSARVAFNKGIAINPKSALNYVGLGMVERFDKNEAAAKANFDKALALAPKDDKPYIYIGKAYMEAPVRSNDAIAILEKGKTLPSGAKDPELLTTLGDAYRSELNSNQAYLSYSDAVGLDPNSPTIMVNIGDLWKRANNFEDATKQFKAALAKDPNYGPAYRQLAETDLLISRSDMKVASVKIKEATEYYKKYLDLTDRSLESRLRYADFLLLSGDYKGLEQETNNLAKLSGSNLRVYRYLAYSAYENGNYQAGLDAITKFMKEADPKRIIPRDYLYLGRLQLKTGRDSLGVQTLRKSIENDTTQVDLYSEIATAFYSKQKYVEAGDYYKKYIGASKKAKLTDYYREGLSYFYAFQDQYFAADKNKNIKPDTALLTKADTAFGYVIAKTAAKPFADAYLYRARANDYKEGDRNNIKGLAKPYYQKYIDLLAAGTPDDKTKKNLAEAYDYLGAYFEYKEKDAAKATDNYTKAKDLDPANKQAIAYFSRKK